MKQVIVMMILLSSFAYRADAQTFSEWFRQKKTQKKYLADQIAALKVYGSYLKKGYDISKKGLGMIGDIKDGDFRMHEGYFDKLKSVNPEISKSPRVKDILSIQEQIRVQADKSKRLAAQSKNLIGAETKYIRHVYERLNTDCLRTIAALEQVLTPGELEMKDDERLERVNILYAESLSQYRFARSFGDGIVQLIGQTDKQRNELKNLRTWYGIKND